MFPRYKRVDQNHESKDDVYSLAVVENTENGANTMNETKQGILVAEGDSWFDFKIGLGQKWDIVGELRKLGYQVESVADRGHTLESMAYSGEQMEELVDLLKEINNRDEVPKAVLLSAGGNDIADWGLMGMMNHHQRPGAGILDGDTLKVIVEGRLRKAYEQLLKKVSEKCKQVFNKSNGIPIIIHGYANPVPNGEEYWGGGRGWLKPAFRAMGHRNLRRNTKAMEKLIGRFNSMLKEISDSSSFRQVTYVDLRKCLSNSLGNDEFERDWIDELHPTKKGFKRIAKELSEKIEEAVGKT